MKEDSQPLPSIIVVIGPTASGKSDFAVDLALQHNGEIISADSRQVYKGLDIGTGKITQQEMKGIPHHMIDVCDVADVFSVARYKKIASPLIDEILARGKTPIICGGTGQYIDALIFTNTFAEVPPNSKLRAELEKKSTQELFNELLTRDKHRAEDIDHNNRVRLIRALEIIDTLGVVPRLTHPILRYNVTMYIMSPTKEQLRMRIHTRLEKRLESNMLDEARALRSRAIPDTRMTSLGLEYAWMNMYLKNEITYEVMKEKLFTAIWRYAKRQITWNKKYESLLFTQKVSLK